MKTGYKQTEIGVIPEDWEVKTIKEISNPVRGGSPRPAGSPKYFNGDYIPWLTVAALTNIPESQIFVSETEGYLTKEGSLHSRTLEKETLIIANSGATLGVAKLLAIKCCANDGIAALFDVDKNAEKRFVVYYINSLTKKLRTVIATGNGQPNLNTDLIGNIVIPFPPLPEQTAIAAALSDVDALMGELDKLIAKKRDIKQATMQQLLTGKKRLAGFSGEWEVTNLGLVCNESMQNGVFFEPSNKGFGIKIINVGDLYKGSPIDIDSLELFNASNSEKERFSVKDGDLFFTRSSVVPSGIAHCNMYQSNQDEPVVFDSHVIRVRPNKQKIISSFLFRFCISSIARNYLVSHAKTGTMTTIDQSVLAKCPVYLPSIEEQTAIATILSDMDAEISQLEARRAKTAQLKQGMMQELLTGRIRLC
jgi:type I restriction enzyme S subunit